MRNLKRALSLAMASVMLLGMMVVGSSAAKIDDFTDKDKIVNKDAVAVTSEIGIFAGFDDGSFGGEKAVTRAEMAVIICKILYGADVNASQFTGTGAFSDVPAWAEGYVNLCSSLGIVAGVGNGKFDPNATVTTAQAALMLEKALGYFKNEKDYNGNWMLAATAKASALKMFGDLKLVPTAPLTRNDVSVLTFNTLTKAVPVQYNEMFGVYYTNSGNIMGGVEFKYDETLGYKNFELAYRGTTDDAGRPAKTWGIGTVTSLNADGSIATATISAKNTIVTTGDKADLTYTSGVKVADLKKDADVSNVADWTVYKNGDDNSGNLANDVLKGEVAEVYLYTSGNVDKATMIVTTNVLGEVSRVTTDKDGKETVSLKNVGKTFEAKGFEKGDIVVYTLVNGDIDTMTMAQSVTGKLTATSHTNRYLTVDGTKYTVAFGSNGINTKGTLINDSDYSNLSLSSDYTLYLDGNGYVLGFEKGEGATSATNYLFIEAMTYNPVYDKWEARFALSDGKKVTAAITIDEDLVVNTGNPAGKYDTSVGSYNNVTAKFTYDEKDGYNLTSRETSSINSGAASGIQKGNPSAAGAPSAAAFNANTIFVDIKGGKTYTGYENVPGFTAGTFYAVENSSNSKSIVVFVVNGTVDDSASKSYVYILGTDVEASTVNNKTVYTYTKAYVDGVKTPVVATSKLFGAVGLYEITKVNVDSQITAATNVLSAPANVIYNYNQFTAGDTSIYAGGTSYKVNSETVFVVVDFTDADNKTVYEGDIDSLKNDDDEPQMIIAKKTGDDVLQLVYVYVD